MNINQNKHNVAKYLPTSDIEPIWEMCVSSIGIQTIGPQETYPAKGHLAKYTFNPERGRIIDEYALVYITKGEGLFSSLTCSCKKITKGDLFFLLPEQWHTYHPSAETGWDEYYVTFHGNYFKKLIPYIINLSYPIFHIGINEQIVKHFGEMLDCAIAQRAGFQALLTGTLMHSYSTTSRFSSAPDRHPHAHHRNRLFHQQKPRLWKRIHAKNPRSLHPNARKHL